MGGVVDEAGAVADLGIEHLTGCEGFVRFYQVDNVEGHLIVGTPGHICVGVGEGCRRNLSVLLEHGLGVGEGHRRAGVGEDFN